MKTVEGRLLVRASATILGVREGMGLALAISGFLGHAAAAWFLGHADAAREGKTRWHGFVDCADV